MSKTAKWLIVTGVILFLIGTGLRIAAASGGECQVFNNHSGYVPGSYDYAEFYEDGQLVTTVQTNGQDIYVAPPNESWDKVKKCQSTTTTTQPEEDTTTTTSETSTTSSSSTTTTLPEESSTTTTAPPSTTTSSQSGTTTTLPAPTFTPRIECRNENVAIDAVWNPSQFLSVDVYLGEPDTTIEAHLILGEEWVTSAAPGQKFTLVGNADGFVQSQIVFAPEGCVEEGIPPVDTASPSAPELPFTGPVAVMGWTLLGLALVGLGVSAVQWGQDDE